MSNENKRYQIFVSSTFLDLIEERAEVTQAIMEINHMPYGMEAFPAANETQWEWIKRAIKESDYYIVIVGGKYGSVNPQTGLGYTEMEYRYAEEVGVPTIAFLVDSSVDLPKSKIETDSAKAEKLQNFRGYIENTRLRKSYTSKEDLKAKVIASVVQLINQCPLIGWIRADSLKNYTSNDEVIRLMKENAELKEEKNVKERIERHSEPYITLKGDIEHILYCSRCWDSEQKMIQTKSYDSGYFKCTNCDNEGVYDEAKRDEHSRKQREMHKRMGEKNRRNYF